MSVQMTEEWLRKAIHAELKAALESEVETVLKDATQKIEKALRRQVAATALTLLQQFDVSRNGRDIIIRVRTEGDTA